MAGKRLGLVDQPLVRQAVSDHGAGREEVRRCTTPSRPCSAPSLSEPQRLTNVTGSGPDASSTPAHAAVSAGIRALPTPDPAETSDHAAVFALRARSAPGPAERTEHSAWLGKVLRMVPEGLRRITRYHSAPMTGAWLCGPDQVEGFPGSVAFEASDDFATGLAFLDAPFVVVLGARVEAQASLHDPVQSGVRLPVAATVETPVLPSARGTLHRTDPAQRGEGRLAAQAFRVVPYRDQQSDGRVRTDTHHREQLRSVAFHEPGQAAFQVLDLFRELSDSLGQQAQGDAGGLQHRLFTVVAVLAVVGELCAGTEEFCVVQNCQFFPQVRVGTDEDGLELVDRLGAGLDRRALGEFVYPGDLHQTVA